MSFNTGNPIGSISEEDCYDNMANLDQAMNSTDPTWRDRFNVEKPTIDAALKSAGFMPAGFDFVTGGTLQPGDRNKAVYNPAPNGDNNWYRWNGAFPKEIVPNSQPNPKNENNWVVVDTDKVLRTDLLNGPLSLLNGIFTLRDFVSVKDFGAKGDGVTDDTAPFLAARAYSFNVHVPDSTGYLINQDITGNFYGYEDIKFTGSGFITYKNITKPEQPRKIRCIAHRAYTGTVAENTIPAIDIAAKNGADGIEIDVQVTSDGVAVLFHDSNLSLQTSGTGAVSANTFATINGLTYKALAGSFLSDTRIPTLNAALKVVKRYNVECFVEIKGYRTIADVDLILDAIGNSGVASKCSILVNSLADLVAVRTSANPVGQSVTIVIAYADQNTWRAKLSEANEYGGKYEFVMYHNNIRGGGAGMVRAINTFSRLGAYWLIPSGVTNSDSNAAQIASDMIALGVDSLTSDFNIKV